MTVGIDIRVLARSTRTGVEEYTINLLSRLLRLDKNLEFKLFFNAYYKKELNYDWLKLPNVLLREFKIPNRFLFIWARYLSLPKIDKLLKGVEVFFNPHFFNAPVSRHCKKVMTFHDLSFEYYPEHFSWRKRLWQKFLMNIRREARQADKIIAVSESTKQDLVDLYKIPEEKVRVIYSGVGEEFKEIRNLKPARSAEQDEAGETRKKIKEEYNLPEKFILYFGTIEPRKNIIGLIKAFELLKEKKDFDNFFLVIAGAKGWSYKNIFRAASESKYASQIIFTGFVEPQDKVYLYNLASLFVYPSFFEGFGFPPLEAMACGVPTITSNTSSLPEVVADAALMIDPFNIGELAWAMEQILTDDGLRQELIHRGLERAKIFSWNKCAEETISLIKQMSNG